MLSVYFFYGSFAEFFLRAALAAIFIAHGWTKIKDLKKNAANFNAMGFRPGSFWGTIAALLEFVGGISLLLGFLVPFLCVFYAIQFVTIIIWKWTKKTPFMGQYGWELDLLILAGVCVLFFVGTGAYALDHLFLLGL
jgi:putative oxidoreductase